MAATKTAISIPQHLFEQMDKLAKRLHVPRSRLFSKAVAEFLHRRGTADLVEQLDRVYAEGDSQPERRLRRSAACAFGRLLRESR